MSAVCELTYLVRALLISSNVRYSNDLANLAITSSRLALSAASEGRKVRDLRAYLRELLR